MLTFGKNVFVPKISTHIDSPTVDMDGGGLYWAFLIKGIDWVGLGVMTMFMKKN